METAFGMKTPEEAAAYLRDEEQKRLQEIRDIVIVAINGNPIKIDEIVVGGQLPFPRRPEQARRSRQSSNPARHDRQDKAWTRS